MSTTSHEQIFELSPTGTTGMQRTLADTVAVELHRAILRGDHPAGSWLRIQDLAAQFDTSSMPVREALRRLDALGLVEVVPHRGARVAQLSVEDLEDTYRARITLESALVGIAAESFTDEDADRARAALEAHEQLLERGEVDEARAAHTEFHFILYRAAQSRWLLRSIEPVWQNSERYRFTAPADTSARDRSHAEHSEILDACVEHDVDRAKKAMQGHLGGAMRRIQQAMTA